MFLFLIVGLESILDTFTPIYQNITKEISISYTSNLKNYIKNNLELVSFEQKKHYNNNKNNNSNLKLFKKKAKYNNKKRQ